MFPLKPKARKFGGGPVVIGLSLAAVPTSRNRDRDVAIRVPTQSFILDRFATVAMTTSVSSQRAVLAAPPLLPLWPFVTFVVRRNPHEEHKEDTKRQVHTIVRGVGVSA